MDRSTNGSAENDRDFQEPDAIKARIAWYYFVGGLTQQEIAHKLKITRTRVNRAVGQLRVDGSVRTEIRLPLAECVGLEDALEKKFGLQSVYVVPKLDSEDTQQRAIGEAAGAMLDGMLTERTGLGVGWGRTLAAALPSLTQRQFTQAWVATLMGGLTQGMGTTTFEVATAFARVMGSECYYLAVPLHLPHAVSRGLLEEHDDIAEVFSRLETTDIALVSCGDLSKRSQLTNTKTVAENLKSLKEAGAVGDILGLFVDENGEPVDHPLNDRLMAMPIESLKRVPTSILASGGEHKMKIIRAVLRAGLVNHFVTDEKCATLLLK
ncbi:sugar-binding transcriptional regulator [uncultured Cohaesibacter sp.]|uniref:sugar-binding transcriptional regulator n=1 Tax=uncultured Cohaesibacter sp. TaxID=1002546 RepID=UPI0029C8AB1D|nr:sugar-binding transcriptional regulator [uncultured Cohaesibacter sp.]